MCGHCDVVKYLLSSGADINLRNKRGQSPLYIASEEGHCHVVKCLLSSCADINLRDEDGQSSLFVASSSGYYDIVLVLTAHGALREENVKAQYKTISKGTKDGEFLADSTTLLNTCGYPEEQISHSKEKQGEEKEAICVPKVQEGKEEKKVEKGELINIIKEKEAAIEKVEAFGDFLRTEKIQHPHCLLL